MRLDEALPALRQLDDDLVAAAVERYGQQVTCARGCSACCRIQPVPVTPAEAYALLLLVRELPEERAKAVRARFEDCGERLSAAGLRDGFLEGKRPVSDEDGRRQAVQYLELGLICPFLEDDACSIYSERPFACREYLVTTPALFCRDPLSLPVNCVPGVPSALEIALALETELTGKAAYSIPLSLALTYAEINEARLSAEYLSGSAVSRAFEHLSVSADY